MNSFQIINIFVSVSVSVNCTSIIYVSFLYQWQWCDFCELPLAHVEGGQALCTSSHIFLLWMDRHCKPHFGVMEGCAQAEESCFLYTFALLRGVRQFVATTDFLRFLGGRDNNWSCHFMWMVKHFEIRALVWAVFLSCKNLYCKITSEQRVKDWRSPHANTETLAHPSPLLLYSQCWGVESTLVSTSWGTNNKNVGQQKFSICKEKWNLQIHGWSWGKQLYSVRWPRHRKTNTTHVLSLLCVSQFGIFRFVDLTCSACRIQEIRKGPKEWGNTLGRRAGARFRRQAGGSEEEEDALREG